jgi:hypothetical protein
MEFYYKVSTMYVRTWIDLSNRWSFINLMLFSLSRSHLNLKMIKRVTLPKADVELSLYFYPLGHYCTSAGFFKAAVVVVRRPASEDKWCTVGRVSNDSDPQSSTL